MKITTKKNGADGAFSYYYLRPALGAPGSARLLLIVALLAGAMQGWTQTVQSDFYVANGPVYASVLSGNILYIGGAFTQVGPATGAGVPIDVNSGLPTAGFPKVVGKVLAVAPDGAGGWFIGGVFTAVGGMPRSNLAHIMADNTVAAWNPNADGGVNALAVSGPTVYAGGDFTSVGGQSRNFIVALDATSGLATAWNPNASGSVFALAVNGSTVYAGGDFTTIGGQIRNRIAALDATSGLATAWNPNANGTVYTLALDGTTNSTLYAGGDFTTIGGQSRNHIAALDATSGQANMLWNPNAGTAGTVFALAVGNGVVYAGGSFTSIGGQQRNHIAEIDAATGLPNLLWNPNTNGDVFSLVVSGTSLYVGGRFTNIGSTPVSNGLIRNYIAQLDATGAATSWNPNANNPINALAVSGSTIYAGGSFTSLGGQDRNFAAALDATTGVVTSWNPSASSTVAALAADSSTVYAGGYFVTIGGQTRKKIAALDPISGAATSWDASANDLGFVFALAMSGSTLYAGGSFSGIGGQPRNNIAALDTTTGAATSWDPNADNQVLALAVNGSVVYAGGSFGNIGGQARSRIAALDAASGLATQWDPNAVGEVAALAVNGSTVFVAGVFSSVGGQARNDIAALDATTGLATAWQADANFRVQSLVVSGPILYVGGYFTTIGGQPRNRIAALDINSGYVTPWNPNVDAPFLFPSVNALAINDSTIYAGGNFTSVGNLPNSYLAAISQLMPVQLTAIVSRKTHGAAGTFDIVLRGQDPPPPGYVAVECRSGGPSGDYTLVFTFGTTLDKVGGVSVTSGSGSGAIDSNDAHNYIVNLTGVTNGQVITVSLNHVTDSAGNFSSVVPVSMGVLLGDVNANRLVNSTDTSLVQAQSGQPVTLSNFRMDVNANGLINSTDTSIVQSKSGTGLPSSPEN